MMNEQQKQQRTQKTQQTNKQFKDAILEKQIYLSVFR
jgi:hypothetical protein